MNINKISWPVFGLAFAGLAIASLACIALLIVVADELAEVGWVAPNLIPGYYTDREAWRSSNGNEFTGEATALLFGASIVPVGVDWISRAIVRYLPFGESAKRFIRRINNVQRKYLMPFHTYLSILALGLGVLHLSLSYCAANLFPEMGLILSGILVATGLLFKLKAVPTGFRKALYQFHTSLIVSGVLLVILFTGHAVMDLD